jgi:hypothetical protein
LRLGGTRLALHAAHRAAGNCLTDGRAAPPRLGRGVWAPVPTKPMGSRNARCDVGSRRGRAYRSTRRVDGQRWLKFLAVVIVVGAHDTQYTSRRARWTCVIPVGQTWRVCARKPMSSSSSIPRDATRLEIVDQVRRPEHRKSSRHGDDPRGEASVGTSEISSSASRLGSRTPEELNAQPERIRYWLRGFSDRERVRAGDLLHCGDLDLEVPSRQFMRILS